MFVLNPITFEYEWVPRGLCFIEGEEGGEGGGEGEASSEGEGQQEPEKVPPADWRAGVSDDLKATADRFDSAESAIRAIADMRKRESQVRVPAEGAEASEVAAYHKAIGVPETAEDYTFPELPEGQLTDEVKADQGAWAEFFKDNSVPKAMAETMVSRFYEQQAAAQELIVAEDKRFAEEQTEALQRKWPGEEFKVNAGYANDALAELANRTGADLEALKQIETKDGRFLLDNADMVQLFAQVGREMKTGTLGQRMSDTQSETIEGQIKDVLAKIEATTDRKEKNRLFAQEQELRGRLTQAA